uniref:Uncharacterized protein n=1 Tax=Solanum lycopersicum TaxID=4081 RepID=A0A3Q7GPC2_SOLLC
RGMTSPP